MKINGTETLMGFVLLCGQYGVTSVLFERVIDPKGLPRCKVTLTTADHTVTGTGMLRDGNVPEVDALDDAFARLSHLVGATITVAGAASGASARWLL